MFGLNMLGMWRNARKGDEADIRRMKNKWGWGNHLLIWHYEEIGGRIIRPWKWHKVYHSIKHLVIEWCRLDSNRAGKLGMDFVSIAFVLGIAVGWGLV